MCGYPLPLQNQRHPHTAICRGKFLNITTKLARWIFTMRKWAFIWHITYIIGIIALCEETKILTATDNKTFLPQFFWHHFHHEDCAGALHLDDRTNDVLVVCCWRHGQSLTGADDHVQGDHIDNHGHDDGNQMIIWRVILSSFDRSSTHLVIEVSEQLAHPPES